MKKIFLYSLMLLSTFAVFSCSDKDNEVSASADRLMRPQFRTRYTVSAGSSDPDLCAVRNLNSIFLSWSLIQDAEAYELKISTEQKVSKGEEAWENPENVLIDTILPAYRDTLLLTNMSYSTSYRFAIRALSSRGEGHHSLWWGYGDGQHWADYLGLQTESRYSTPEIITNKANRTKEGFRVYLDRKVYADAADYDEWADHFTQVDSADAKVWKCDYLRVAASESSPNAQVPSQFQHYDLTAQDFARGYVDIAGLDSNSVYIIDVVDKDIPIFVDAVYNTQSVRTKGDPGAPILINEANGYMPVDTMNIDGVVYNFADYANLLGSGFKATRIDNILRSFMSDNTLAENQTFYLEGGKVYFTTANMDLFKGFTLMTDPADIAAGKGNAKVFDLRNVPSSTGSPAFFMLGRMPMGGENANISIDIEDIVFENIDFDFPGAHNSAQGGATGNYLFNQYSGGMGIHINNFIIRGCTFQRFVRGFGRTQCKYGEYIENFLVESCEFFNCGGYSGNGSGYGFFTGDLNNPKSNCFHNMVWRNNTFYETPIGNFITHGTGTGKWADPNLVFNITIENNTFVNWNTYSGRPMVSMRSLPTGSTITIRKNLFIQTKSAGDERQMNLQGADVRTLNGVCEDKTTFNIYDNWSTNDNISESTGDIFTANGFSANKNSFGAFLANPDVVFPAGAEELLVHIAPISATELMQSPNPPVPVVGTETDYNHSTGSIDGSAPTAGVNSLIGGTANLYFKNFDNEIVKRGIGAPKWRTPAASAK